LLMLASGLSHTNKSNRITLYKRVFRGVIPERLSFLLDISELKDPFNGVREDSYLKTATFAQ